MRSALTNSNSVGSDVRFGFPLFRFMGTSHIHKTVIFSISEPLIIKLLGHCKGGISRTS